MIEVPGNAVQDEDSSEIPQEQVDLSQIPIEELELSVRAFNCLKRAGINSIDQLVDKTEDELDKEFGIWVKNQLMKSKKN